ncbi:MAG: phage holin family protein [Paludibacter sp.]
MDEFISNLIAFCKPFIVLITTFIVSIFSPIQDVLYVLGLSFLFNIITGIVTDIHVNEKEFSLKKAFDSVFQLTFYGALVFFIHNVAVNLGNHALGDEGVKYTTFIVVYFYLCNILRNAGLVFPKNKAISFLYEVMTTQIFTRIKSALFMNINSNKDEK